MSGTGVTLDPSDALGTILEFFDQSVMDGTLVGSGGDREVATGPALEVDPRDG